MNNLEIYNTVAAVPPEAQKEIGAGRLKGMTDINPMWRIKILTETFGMVGFGWKYVITDKRIIEGANGVHCAFVDIDLFVKVDGEWSEAIQGTGGSQFVAAERSGMYTSDECFKMALTDAISVACKALGVGADVYWKAGRTKYNNLSAENQQQPPPTCADCKKPFTDCTIKGKLYNAVQVFEMAKKMSPDGIARCKSCREKNNPKKEVSMNDL